MRSITMCVALALMVSALTVRVTAQAAVAGTTTNDGVYSTAQAARGQKLFEAHCTACHDTARFTGGDFIKAWSGHSMQELFDLVKTTMPEDNPGSLQPQQYADVLSYFLQLNKYPGGATELSGTDDAMKVIRIAPLK